MGLLARAPEEDLPDGPAHHAILDHLDTAGASFWPQLVEASTSAGVPNEDSAVLEALWDLVWAGQVTNDSLAPLRALLGGASAGKGRAKGRPRPGRLRRQGPQAGMGRWSLVSSLVGAGVDPTMSTHARAVQLLERYGVVTREAVLSEGHPGGFAGVYPVLKALEEQGKVRRGYFVVGLGAAQFALPGAVDRLRDQREEDASAASVVLAATDPAQPFGAALAWPDSQGRPARAAQAYVFMTNGRPGVYVERGGKSLVTFGVESSLWAPRLADAVRRGDVGTLEVVRIDGAPASESAAAKDLLEAGFTRGYKGFVLRAARRSGHSG